MNGCGTDGCIMPLDGSVGGAKLAGCWGGGETAACGMVAIWGTDGGAATNG
jgi:hypothetical protein